MKLGKGRLGFGDKSGRSWGKNGKGDMIKVFDILKRLMKYFINICLKNYIEIQLNVVPHCLKCKFSKLWPKCVPWSRHHNRELLPTKNFLVVYLLPCNISSQGNLQSFCHYKLFCISRSWYKWNHVLGGEGRSDFFSLAWLFWYSHMFSCVSVISFSLRFYFIVLIGRLRRWDTR